MSKCCENCERCNCKECCVVKYRPNKKTLVKCCCCNVTHYGLFVAQLIFTVGFHFWDIGSDIFVLIDLKNNNTEYFALCLVIILLPIIATDINSFKLLRKNTCDCKGFLYMIVMFFGWSVLQGNVFYSLYNSIKSEKKDYEFVDLRLRESLLESAPEALFQMFILLKSTSTYTYNQLVIYYLSITNSILSLTSSLISYELYMHNLNINEGYVLGIKLLSTEFTLYMTSKHIFVLFFYRLTEIFSRIGLVSCVGYLYDGYVILWFLLGEFIFSSLLHSVKSIKNCDFIYYVEETGEIYIFRTVIMFLMQSVKRLKELSVYPYKFLVNNKKTKMLVDINTRGNPKFHFTCRYLSNAIISVIIIYSLSTENYSYSFNVISISSICCFVVNIPLLLFILSYSYNFKENVHMLRKTTCGCECSCKNICSNKVQIEKNEKKDIYEAEKTVVF